MLWLVAALPFFFSTLEEYYTDCLYLPPINGVNEGGLFAVLTMVFTGFVGNDFWANSVILFGEEFIYGQLLVYAFFFSTFGFVLIR